MPLKRFLQGNEGVIASEYVVFVAAIGIILVLGVWFLFTSISGYYGAWGNYFSAGNRGLGDAPHGRQVGCRGSG